MTTGELIKAWRERAQLTQEELAIAAGYESRSYIGDIERNRSTPTVRKLLRLIAAIERSYLPLPEPENERLARFFLGPESADGLLIVPRKVYRPGARKRRAKDDEPTESAARRSR